MVVDILTNYFHKSLIVFVTIYQKGLNSIPVEKQNVAITPF